MNIFSCCFAEVNGPLFGSPWLALLTILGVIALFMAAVAGVGRWLAATHPSPLPAQLPGSHALLPAEVRAPADVTPPQILAIIAAAVRVTFGADARIAQVAHLKPAVPSVEMLMQQWSMEGRRQIYSSHQIR